MGDVTLTPKISFSESFLSKEKASLADATNRFALNALSTWERMFDKNRKSPKKTKTPLNLYREDDVNGQSPMMSMSDFKKILKGKRSSDSGFAQAKDIWSRQNEMHRNAYDVGALSSRRKKQLEQKENERSRFKKTMNTNTLLNGGSVSSKDRKKEKSAHWVDLALLDNFVTYRKDSGKSPGDLPVTWKNPEKGVTRTSRKDFPDYYMRSMVRLRKVSPLGYILTLSPKFAGDKSRRIFESLNFGGNVVTKKKVMIGYAVSYRSGSIRGDGKRMTKNGLIKVNYRERRRIRPLIVTETRSVSVRPYPFLMRIEAAATNTKLKYFKNLLK